MTFQKKIQTSAYFSTTYTIQPLVKIQHAGFPSLAGTCQVSSCGRALAHSVCSAWNSLSPAVCLDGWFPHFRSQVKVRFLERALLVTFFPSRSFFQAHATWAPYLFPHRPFIGWIILFTYLFTFILNDFLPVWGKIHDGRSTILFLSLLFRLKCLGQNTHLTDNWALNVWMT